MVSDITKKTCKLKWKPPLDDGGSPIEYYEMEKLDPNTGEWVPAGTSPTCEGDVKGLQEGKEYKFRVRRKFNRNSLFQRSVIWLPQLAMIFKDI